MRRCVVNSGIEIFRLSGDEPPFVGARRIFIHQHVKIHFFIRFFVYDVPAVSQLICREEVEVPDRDRFTVIVTVFASLFGRTVGCLNTGLRLDPIFELVHSGIDSICVSAFVTPGDNPRNVPLARGTTLTHQRTTGIAAACIFPARRISRANHAFRVEAFLHHRFVISIGGGAV